MKKNIVLSIFTLQGGGAERFVLTLAEAFRDAGHDIHVLCFKRQNDYHLPKGVKFHYLNYQAFRSIPKGALRYRLFAKVFDRYVKKHIGQPDLIVSNLREVDAVLHYSRLPNIVYVLHNTVSREYDLTSKAGVTNSLKQRYNNRPVVGVSDGVVDDYQRTIAQHPRICTIYNPIPQQQLLAKSRAFTPELPSRYFVHVGRFKAQKDHQTLVRAYAKTPRKCSLVLVGTGPLESEIKNLVEELGIADRVIFTGFQENPYPYIARAQAMVLSSQFEGFGIVIAEALAVGVPVISTDCQSGPRELLPEKNLVPVGDVDALAEKMAQACENPDEYRSEFDNNLLPEAVAEKYLSILSTPTLH